MTTPRRVTPDDDPKDDYTSRDLDRSDLEDGPNRTGQFTPTMLSAWCNGLIGDVYVDNNRLNERKVDVRYDSLGISVNLDGEGEDVEAGMYAVISPQQARELGAALQQAAAELDHILSQDYDEWREEQDG